MMRTKLANIFNRMLDSTFYLVAGMIVFSMLVVCAEVLIRFWGKDLNWVIDVTGILLLYMAFVGSAWLLKDDAHVRMGMLLNRLGPRAKARLNAATAILGAIVFVLLTWYGVKFTLHFYSIGHYQPTTLETPTFLILIIIPIGTLLLLIQSLRMIWGYLKEAKLPQEEKTG